MNHTEISVLLALFILPFFSIGCIEDAPTGDPSLPTFEVIEIGPGSDSTSHHLTTTTSRPTAINESGQVAGIHFPPELSLFESRAYYWSEDDGFHSIDPFTVTDAEEDSAAWDIDEDGAVYGFAEDADADGEDQAMRWTVDGGLESLGRPDGTEASRILSVNSHGDFAGQCSKDQLGSGTIVCVYIDGQWETAEPLGNYEAVAYGINDDGVAAARSTVSVDDTLYHRPAIWDKENGLRDLGSFDGDPTSEGGVHDINNQGQIIGYSEDQTVPSSNSFLWDDDSMNELATFDDHNGSVYAINNDSYAVGSSYVFNKGHATIWTPDNRALDLNDQIAESGKWHIWAAFDINDNKEIVGVAERDGENYAVLLRPIEDDDE